MMENTIGGAFERYMTARLEQNEALLEWMGAGEDKEADPWRRAQAAKRRRDAAADECVGILLEDPLSAKSRYDSLRERLRAKCDQPTWEKMIEHLRALDETFHAQYRRAWFTAAIHRYGPVLLAGILIGAALAGS